MTSNKLFTFVAVPPSNEKVPQFLSSRFFRLICRSFPKPMSSITELEMSLK